MPSNNIIAIIPARGGSKGLPRKNVLPLMGKPLIAHSIEQALKSGQIQSVIVSTEDEEIAEISQQYGASVCRRPMELAGDTCSSESALLHVLRTHPDAQNANAIVFLQCTSPCRQANDLKDALEQFCAEKLDSLLSVNLSHGFYWKDTASGPMPTNYNYQNRPRRQDREPEYWENGSFYIFKPNILIEYQNRLGGKIGRYIMKETCIDIDCATDFNIAEILLKTQSFNANH